VTISDILVYDSLIIYAASDPHIVIDDADFVDANVWVEMDDGDLVITNSSIGSAWSRGMYLYPTMANVTIQDCTFYDSHLMIMFNNMYWAAPNKLNITGCRFGGNDGLLYVGWDIINVDTYDVDADYVPTINGSIEDNDFRATDGHVVLHYGLFHQLWGDNDLDDGTHLQAFYITRLQMIPPESSPFWGAYTFLPREGVVTDWPFETPRIFIELDGEIMIDVTEDPSAALDPPVLDIFLHSITNNKRIVRGFHQVVPDDDNDEATYPVYPQFQELLQSTLIHWPPLDEQD